MDNNLKRKNNETEEEYLWRVGKLIDSGEYKNWKEISNIINKEFNIDEDKWRDESAFRKPYQYAKKFYDNVFSKMIDKNSDEDYYINELQEVRRELERARIQYRDERNAWQKQNYAEARAETTLELLEEKLTKLGKVNFEDIKPPRINSNKEMVVMLSDLHIGASFSSAFGEYDSDIAKERLTKYLNKCIQVGKTHSIKKVHVVGLGDQISGSIHKSIQITNKENVVDQVKLAIQYISSFCYELCKNFETVKYCDVVGNHSRIDRKDDALHNERLDSIIGWGVGLSLGHIDNFSYVEHRNIDVGIADINVCGKTFIAVHGDYDPMSKQGIANLSMMLGFIPYGILRGHMHYPAMSEISSVKVVQSGSLTGCGDDYTIEKRLNGRPSQTILVCDTNGIDAIYNVNLD